MGQYISLPYASFYWRFSIESAAVGGGRHCKELQRIGFRHVSSHEIETFVVLVIQQNSQKTTISVSDERA